MLNKSEMEELTGVKMAFTIPADYLHNAIIDTNEYISKHVGKSVKVTFKKYWFVSSGDAKKLFKANPEINYISCYWANETYGPMCICIFHRSHFNLK